jgi:hypothetical protein
MVEVKLMSTEMKLIMENWRRNVLKEAEWSTSPDFDWPASAQPKYAKQLKSSRVIVFNPDDSYDEAGDTHGKDSHMIKHHVEFFPNQVQSMAQKTIDFLNNNNIEVYTISGNSTPQKIDRDQIEAGDILNTYDFLNDKKLNGDQLSEKERIIYSKHMNPLIAAYDGMVDKMMNNAIDLSNSHVQTPDKLAKILDKRPIISFKAVYDGSEKEYFVDTANSAMVGSSNGVVATLFNRVKKSPGKKLSLRQALKDFATGKSTVPIDEYSILRDYIDNLLTSSQPVKQKKKQPRKKKRPNIRAIAIGMSKGGKSPEEIQTQIKKSAGIDISIENISKMIG